VMTLPALTRRYVLLVALHWLPVGMTVPVMVLLMLDRGLTLGQVGLAFALFGILGAVLELPTVGLADVVGRRPVLLAAVALHLLACLLYAGAGTLAVFLVAVVLKAVGRALFSGPLEAWYVDAAHALDPDADLAPGLSRGSAADGGGLAVGAALGGGLPAALGSLAAPFLVAAALDVLFLVAAWRLLHEQRPPREGTLRAELGTGLRAVPSTVAGAVRLAVTDGPMRLVLLVTAVGGVALVSFELLGPPRFAELVGGREEGAAVLGTVQAVAFGAAAGAALLAPTVRRLLRGSTRWACAALALAGAAGLAGFAAADVVLLAAAALTGYYVTHAAQWPLLSTVLHGRVTAAQRATAVSAMSLSLLLGGTLANLVLPRLPSPFLVAAALVALSALLCLRLPRVVREPAPSAPESTVTAG
jgi:hypothetical protein